MSAELSSLARHGIGVCIWCSGSGCRRGSVYVPIAEAIARFGPVTCEEAQRKVRCEGCGARGRDGKIQILPSTMDVDDVRHGLPAGTSERESRRRALEAERRQREECAARGWDWDEIYGQRRAWPRA
jgi:hypothetical protein